MSIHSISEEIDSFKTTYEQTVSQEPDSKRILIETYRRGIPANFTFSQAQQELQESLSSLPSYLDSQEKVLSITYAALQSLLKNPLEESVAFAKRTYKQIASFLRKQTDKKWIEAYTRYLEPKRLLQRSLHSKKPAAFLEISEESQEENHAALTFLLRQLRKQIKLAGKQDKILAHIEAHPKLRELSVETKTKALAYLHLTWMHGTKASVIQSACELSNGELLPAGELQKRNIQILTGEMQEGSTTMGINQRFLSGVNLLFANVGRSYAHDFEVNIETERREYENFLAKRFGSRLQNYLETSGNFSRTITALKRLQYEDPEIFQRDSAQLERKLEEIYAGLEGIFSEKPKELFNWHDHSYISLFYSFLKTLENYEKLIRSPPPTDLTSSKEFSTIPIVLASKTAYGIPSALHGYIEPYEEVISGSMQLGRDLQVVFAEEKDRTKVEALVERVGLKDSLRVESMNILTTAWFIEQRLAPYFYDIYSLRKWQTISL